MLVTRRRLIATALAADAFGLRELLRARPLRSTTPITPGQPSPEKVWLARRGVPTRWRRNALGFESLLVTHDSEEALVVADRVVVTAGPPGRIVADIRVDAARPRDRTAASLQALRWRITEAIADPDAAARRMPTGPIRYLGREA